MSDKSVGGTHSQNSTPKIAVIGSVNLDFIIQTQTLPKAGETIGNGSFLSLPGGKGANVALMAKRLGAEVTLFACLGDDGQAQPALASLKAEGVNLDHVQYLDDHPTGIAFINVSAEGENQIAVASGANMAFSPNHLGNIKTDAILTQFEIPDGVILDAIKKTDCFVCLNASPIGSDLTPFLDYVDLLIVNEGEYEAYETALTPYKGLVAITLGAKGAKIVQEKVELAKATPPPVKAVDTTGAGDSFAAALTVALMEKQPIKEALEFACCVGGLTTTKMGTQSAAPYRHEVEAALNPVK